MGTKSIKKNYLYNIALTLSSLIFPMIVYPYVTRTIGPSGIGKVSFATSLLSYFGIFAQLGVPTYGIRECARVRNNIDKLSKLTIELLIINTVTCSITYIVFLLSVFFIPRLQGDKALYLFMSISLLLNAIGMDWLYRGLEEYRYITIRSLAFKLIAIILMFLTIRDSHDYIKYGVLTVFASSASNVLNLINLRRIIILSNVGELELRKHISRILVFVGMTCATTVYMNLDTIMLGVLTTDKDVGYYDAAVKIKKVIVAIVTSLGGVLLPRLSMMEGEGDWQGFSKLCKKSLNYTVTISIPLVAFFVCFAKQCILILCGKEFYNAIVPMRIILITVVFIGISNITGVQVMVPKKMEKGILISEICGAIIDVIFNAMFIPRFGASGAAAGTVLAEMVVLVVQVYLIREYAVKLFKGIQFFKILLATIIACVIAQIVNIYSYNIVVDLVVGGMGFFLMYVIILILLKQDFVVSIINNVKRR
ncbi:MAG: flippase [Butyrivibrio sp.]|nr:flippase [Butyrivibrio sp.]